MGVPGSMTSSGMVPKAAPMEVRKHQVTKDLGTVKGQSAANHYVFRPKWVGSDYKPTWGWPGHFVLSDIRLRVPGVLLDSFFAQ